MPGEYPTIYQKARKESLYTQAEAAERLFVSEKTLKAWEQGQRRPDNETVARMADLYGTPWLQLECAFLALSELGILPNDIHAKELSPAVVTMVDSIQQLLDRYRRLFQIAADNHIDDTELADFETIKSIIIGNVVAELQVAHCYQANISIKEDRPVAGTTRRPEVRTCIQTIA